MDGLALLCNLFADGPVTLKRLRAAHVSSLSELERASPERLAGWLHASVPQARAFLEEGRKLVRRLAETAPALAEPARSPGRALAGRADAALGAPLAAAARAHHERGQQPLVPGLFAGLDEGVCARLARHQVRTVQSLSESAGLALARRSGIPYSILLELARGARRWLAGRESVPGMTAGPSLPVRELVPFVREPRRAPAENELARSDEFTLPSEATESAGPFV